MNIIKKFAAAFAVLALTAGAQAATTSVGAVDSTTDFLAGTDGTVTYGKTFAFSDVYSFTLADSASVTGFAQVVGKPSSYTLTGGSGELELFEGTPGSSTLVDTSGFGISGATLTDLLGAGSYYFDVVGKTAGSSGGKYFFELTAAAVPEPTNVALMLAGLGIIGGLARRRRQG